MDEELTYSLSEPTWVKEIYQIVCNLLQEGRISGNPENVKIQRLRREAIQPCGKSPGPVPLKLNQLEWATQKGSFWFRGPVKSLKVNLDRGPIKGCLVSEPNKETFTTTLNELNFKDFVTETQRLVENSTQFGYQVRFDQPDISHNVRVSISAPMLLSEQNVNEFIERIEKILKTI